MDDSELNSPQELANQKAFEEIKIGGTGSSSPLVNESQRLRNWRRIPRDIIGNLNDREIGNLDINGDSVLPDGHQKIGGIWPAIKKENSNSTIAEYDAESGDDAHYAESDDGSSVADNIEKHDHLVESVKRLQFAQMGFEIEVQRWREIGQDGPLTFDDPPHEVLEVKDSKILELESVLYSEDRLMKIIQTDVEYVVITTTTKILTECVTHKVKKDLQKTNVSFQENKIKENQDEILQTQEGLKKMQNRVCEFILCFIIMLVLLLVMFYLESAPQNVEDVLVPT